MQKLLIVVCLFCATHASAQTAVNDSSTLKQYSIGLNALRLLPGSRSSNPALIGFVQYRRGFSAYRLGFSAVSDYSQRAGNTDFPNSIYITDSTITVGEKYHSRSGGGMSVEYLRYSKRIASKVLQLYGGVGFYGGAVNSQTGSTYALYNRDSLRTYQYDQSLSSVTEVNRQESTKGLQLGVIPTAGLMLFPTGRVSVGLELRVPWLFEQSRSYDGVRTMSGFGMDTHFACNVALNLDGRGRRG